MVHLLMMSKGNNRVLFKCENKTRFNKLFSRYSNKGYKLDLFQSETIVSWLQLKREDVAIPFNDVYGFRGISIFEELGDKKCFNSNYEHQPNVYCIYRDGEWVNTNHDFLLEDKIIVDKNTIIELIKKENLEDLPF